MALTKAEMSEYLFDKLGLSKRDAKELVGLRPGRWFLSRKSKLPKPESFTCSPFSRARRISSNAKELVELFFEEIRRALENGEQVKLSGFGNFDLRFNFWPGLKVTTRRAVMGISSPVFGLRPGRWFLSRDAKELVELFFEEIRRALENGEQVKLSGFGNFDYRRVLPAHHFPEHDGSLRKTALPALWHPVC
jgi:integration host factor subunit alpha